MKPLVLACLILPSLLSSAFPSEPEFRVDLFSNRSIESITLRPAKEGVKICGSNVAGPCLLLPFGHQMVCYADRLVHCRVDLKDRTFTRLTVDAAVPFAITPAVADENHPGQTFLIQNARVVMTGGAMRISTKVDLESYVSGVLRGEAATLRSPAARQAMAIVARTWALRWKARHRAQGFDFCSLTHCQVFRPPQDRDLQAADGLDPAARATRGQVLQYHGELADPYFTACCGGMTESAGNVWPDRAQPYLVSVHDPYCLASIQASWKQAFAAADLQAVLRDALHLPMSLPLGELSVERRDASGRALVLRVVAGDTWDIDANQFRYAVDRRLGWEQIKSNLYSIQHQGSAWTFSGHGLGHGVGLCQAGAEQMALLGFSPQRILNAYFPGTEIALRASDEADPIASSEHFELVYSSSQEPWVKQTLDTLEQWRKELDGHAVILPPRVRVKAWASVADFTRATGQPGWLAASSDGQSIDLQPLDLLARKTILSQTLRHELTHLVLHRLSAKNVPRWFEEGAVLYLTGENIGTSAAAQKTRNELEKAVSHPRSEAEMRSAYVQSLELVKDLAGREGGTSIWRVLEHPTTDDWRWLREGE
jgi:stage II sporulation protein D